MPVESATYISQLNPSYPDGAENVSDGDNHVRLMKSVLQGQFTSLGAAAVTKTAAELNSVTDRALRAGDTYTGTHDFDGATAVLVPTVATADSSTNAASTAMVQAAIAAVNAQTALTVAVNSATSVTASVGQHVVNTNAAATTVTLPASPSAGDRVKVTFTNTLYSNVINPNGNNVFGVAGNRTVNAAQAAPEFVYANASVGWVY